jgi:Rho-related BTB domain-containing protein 3
VALGNEGDAFHQDNRPSGLIRTYLGRSPLVSGDESSLLLNATSTVARPVFTEYQASAFGNVKLVVHDCPVWVRAFACLFFFFPFPPFHKCGLASLPG